MLSKRMQKLAASKDQKKLIEGKGLEQLIKANKEQAKYLGWFKNIDIIARILDTNYRWDDDWEKFVKLLYAWQKKMYQKYKEIDESYFGKEWGVIGEKTIELLNYVYESMIYQEDKEEKGMTRTAPSGGKTPIMPAVVLANEESGDLLVRAAQALQRVLPRGSSINSGYRSAGTQKKAIDKYFDMATDHPAFSKFKNRYLELRDKKEIAEQYMQNIEGRTGWRIALPGLSNHQRGLALDISGNNKAIVNALERLKGNPINGITIETSMGDRGGILPEGSHVHAVFKYA